MIENYLSSFFMMAKIYLLGYFYYSINYFLSFFYKKFSNNLPLASAYTYIFFSKSA